MKKKSKGLAQIVPTSKPRIILPVTLSEFASRLRYLNLFEGVQFQDEPSEPDTDHSSSDLAAENRYRRTVERKLESPDRYPTMNQHEVSIALGIKKSKVYSHADLERVSTGTAKVLFTTASVAKLRNRPPED